MHYSAKLAMSVDYIKSIISLHKLTNKTQISLKIL